MAEGGDLLDQKQYWYHRLFGSSDFEDEQPLPSPPIVQPVVQTKPQERCILRLRVRKIPGTNMYKNLSYKNQDDVVQEPKVEDANKAERKLHCEERLDDVVQEPKVEAAKRKLHCEEKQEKAGNKITAKPKLQVSKCAKKNHGDTVRARIEWRSKHLAVRKSKYLQVHKPNLLIGF